MSKRKVIAVIPARMQSSRFPGKPLARILDLPMIEHVRRRVCLAKNVDEVYVATCDREIKETVEDGGGNAIMTADTHERCTDRVCEAVQGIDADIVVIMAGDEPVLVPDMIDLLVEPMVKDATIQCANMVSVIHSKQDLEDKDIVKAVLDHNNNIMYFSRSAIPYKRAEWQSPFYRQTGVQAFTKSFLEKYSQLEPTPLEITESIDFLRILEHGFTIAGVVYDQTTIGVDQKEHIQIAEHIIENEKFQREIYEKILHQPERVT